MRDSFLLWLVLILCTAVCGICAGEYFNSVAAGLGVFAALWSPFFIHKINH